MKFPKIGVMCGSSEVCDPKFLNLATKLGNQLANNKHVVIYGGGKKGLMRRVADGALESKGEVIGVIPHFMKKVEWHHDKVTTLHFTEDMATRKQMMMQESNATIFLPGGCGTMEEFFEWLSAKRLGQYIGPLIVVNFDGYYDSLKSLLDTMIKERFHAPVHEQMYSFIDSLDQLEDALNSAPEWKTDAINHASVK